MNEREFDQMLVQMLGQDFSVGTERFRDNLLERCLEELGNDSEGLPLADEDLDMLAAAGNIFESGFDKLP